MPVSVRVAEYFYAKIVSDPHAAYELLAALAAADVNILAFSAIPYGEGHVELTLFPDSTANLVNAARKSQLSLTGPQHAVLIQDDDCLGAVAGIHRKLLAAGVRVYASTGVTSGEGRYGYVIYLKEGDHEAAARALSV